MLARWNYPTSIIFGQDALAQLKPGLQHLSLTNPLVVCDQFILQQPWFANLALNNVEIFTQFKTNPDEKNVEQGVLAYNKHHCDGIVAIGGGSALDTAKTIALMCGQTRAIWEFIDAEDNYLRADASKIASILAIPTTAGTGAEVGRAAVIVDSQTQAKHLIFHPKMLPGLVLCSPEVTVTVPANLTAATGMDALAHCLEAYFAPGFHPMADGIALEGARLIKENLIKAFEHGDNLDARAKLMAAATMGGTAFQKGLGLIHALSHPVGGLYDVHHGLLNAIFMPYVLAFNRQSILTKCERLARYLNLTSFDFDGVYQWVIELNQSLGIPQTLQQIGVDDTKLDLIAELAMQDPSALGNPTPLTQADCYQVLQQALTKDD